MCMVKECKQQKRVGEIMTEEQKEYLKEFGFKVSDEDERGRTVVFSEMVPDLISLEMLILTMTFYEEISYWDADWKSPIDPGGYVTALRLDNERVAYREGNHGWISKWYIVSVEEMAKHIQKNWDKDCDRGMYLNNVQIEHNKYITRQEIDDNLNIM